jgi:hypothetical protein
MRYRRPGVGDWAAAPKIQRDFVELNTRAAGDEWMLRQK